MNCTVHIRPDGAEAWIPTQAPQWAQSVIAEAAKLPPEKVIVHTTLMGGGFGRRYQADFVMEAAQVAAKSAGKPIMVFWTREDDMQHGFYRPASYHKMQGVLDGNGSLAAWKHFQTSTSIAAKWSQKGAEDSGWASSELGPPFLTSHRISASSTCSPNRVCPAPGGVPSNTPAAASSWRVLLTSLRPLLARIRWRSE